MSESELFASTWMVWASKGHEPIKKIKLQETPEGIFVSILDYITLENHFPLSSIPFYTYEDALAWLGRAIDDAINTDNQK